MPRAEKARGFFFVEGGSSGGFRMVPEGLDVPEVPDNPEGPEVPDDPEGPVGAGGKRGL